IGEAMTHPLPLSLQSPLDHRRIDFRHIRVEGNRSACAYAVEGIHEAPDTYPLAVLANRPLANGGHLAPAGTGEAVVERIPLEVGDDPDRHAGVMGPPNDRRIGISAVGHGAK